MIDDNIQYTDIPVYNAELQRGSEVLIYFVCLFFCIDSLYTRKIIIRRR